MLLYHVSGALVFQLKKRPPDYVGRKGRKVDDKGLRGKEGSSSSLPPEKLPYLVELSPGTTTTLTSTHNTTELALVSISCIYSGSSSGVHDIL